MVVPESNLQLSALRTSRKNAEICTHCVSYLYAAVVTPSQGNIIMHPLAAQSWRLNS